MTGLDNFYLQKEEPIKSCLLALKEIILSYDIRITPNLKYGLPFFIFNKKNFCYLWVDKKTKQPYIGFVEGKKLNHPMLISGNRVRMKILMVDSNEDLPILVIENILKQAIDLYK